MNILQIVRGLDIGGDSGGAEKFGVELGRALNRAGCNVTLCAFFRVHSKMEAEWEKRLTEEGIRTFFLTDWNGYGNVTAFRNGLMTLREYLKGYPPFDVVHSHFLLGNVTALWLKLIGRARTAYRTSHILREWTKGKHTGWLNLLFIQYLFSIGLDAEIGVSQAIVDYLASHPGARISRHKPHLIRNAVSFNQPPSEPGRVPFFSKKPGTYIVGSVGRLETQKGYTYLLEAIPKILTVCPQTNFYVIGEGSLHHDLEEKASRLKISSRIQFVGIRDDIPYLLQEMDLFVLPSLWEGFPTVLLESMICNVPVIATDIPGTRELVRTGQNGWLVAPQDPAALADTIIEALNNPKLRETCSQQAALDVRRFTIENISEEYLQLYRTHLPT